MHFTGQVLIVEDVNTVKNAEIVNALNVWNVKFVSFVLLQNKLKPIQLLLLKHVCNVK